MGESRKSDFTGEQFGDWVVIGRGDGEGDRKRRWVVRHWIDGTEMTVLQTGLSDLALAKRLADKAAASDAARTGTDLLLSPAEAEKDLLRRLDGQIGRTLAEHMLMQEAVASVALDHDAECGTYSIETLNGMTVVLENHPFNDYYTAAEQEIAGGEVFGLSPTTLSILADRDHCLDCDEGNHPEVSDVGYVELQKAAIEAQINGKFVEHLIPVDPAFTHSAIAPVSAIETGMGFVEPTGAVLIELDDFKMILYRAAAKCVHAQEAAKAAEHMLCDILEGLLP